MKQAIQRAVNNIKANKKRQVKYRNFSFCAFYTLTFVGIHFFGTVFVILFVASIISSDIPELSLILPEYLPFFQAHLTGFQI